MQLKVFLLFTLIEVPTDDAFFSQWSAQMMMSLLQYRKHHSVILNGAGKNRPNAVSCAFIALPFLSVQRTTAKSRPQYMMQRTFQPSRKSRGKSKTKKKKKKKVHIPMWRPICPRESKLGPTVGFSSNWPRKWNKLEVQSRDRYN